MSQVKRLSSSAMIILLVAGLTVLSSTFLLFALSQTGVIAFTGGGWWVNVYHVITGYLGYSILFFIPTLFGYFIFFGLLQKSLSGHHHENGRLIDIRFYSGGMDMFISLFFGIGVLFTAWGLSNALVTALAGLNKEEAGRLGAWGILKRLVDNGILIALWTTIVGGGGGYLLRLFKYISLGRALDRISFQVQEAEKSVFFSALESIRVHVERIEARMTKTE